MRSSFINNVLFPSYCVSVAYPMFDVPFIYVLIKRLDLLCQRSFLLSPMSQPQFDYWTTYLVPT